MKDSTKRYINYTLLGAVIILTYRALFKGMHPATAFEVLKGTNKIFLSLCFISQLCFWLADSAITYFLLRFIGELQGHKALVSSFILTMTGQFYSLITPFASGAQPAQLYYMKTKNNLSYGRATAIIVNKFVAYQLVVTVLAIIIFPIRYSYISNLHPYAKIFIIIGILIHGLGSLLVFGLIFSKVLIHRISLLFISILRKFKINKDIGSVEKFTEDYRHNLILLLKNKKLLLGVILLTVIQLLFYFDSIFLVYKALNLKGESFINICSLQVQLYIAISFLPLPGAVGASELGFHAIMKMVFGKDILKYGILLWRIITYYFSLLFSGVVILIHTTLLRNTNQPSRNLHR